MDEKETSAEGGPTTHSRSLGAIYVDAALIEAQLRKLDEEARRAEDEDFFLSSRPRLPGRRFSDSDEEELEPELSTGHAAQLDDPSAQKMTQLRETQKSLLDEAARLPCVGLKIVDLSSKTLFETEDVWGEIKAWPALVQTEEELGLKKNPGHLLTRFLMLSDGMEGWGDRTLKGEKLRRTGKTGCSVADFLWKVGVGEDVPMICRRLVSLGPGGVAMDDTVGLEEFLTAAQEECGKGGSSKVIFTFIGCALPTKIIFKPGLGAHEPREIDQAASPSTLLLRDWNDLYGEHRPSFRRLHIIREHPEDQQKTTLRVLRISRWWFPLVREIIREWFALQLHQPDAAAAPEQAPEELPPALAQRDQHNQTIFEAWRNCSMPGCGDLDAAWFESDRFGMWRGFLKLDANLAGWRRMETAEREYREKQARWQRGKKWQEQAKRRGGCQPKPELFAGGDKEQGDEGVGAGEPMQVEG